MKQHDGLIYIIEDEESLLLLLKYNLEQAGYGVECISRGDEADIRIAEQKPDLILLDWMLPGLSGIELCRRLKAKAETKDVPIIMLTARSEEHDKILGLNTGADDYVVKPFSVQELLARIVALLRRSNPSLVSSHLQFDDLILNKVESRVMRGNKIIHLGPTEFKLLLLFISKPKRVYSREQITNAVWGYDTYIDERTVDVHIGRLRKALNEKFREKKYIRTVRSVGLCIRCSSAMKSGAQTLIEAFKEPVLVLNTHQQIVFANFAAKAIMPKLELYEPLSAHIQDESLELMLSQIDLVAQSLIIDYREPSLVRRKFIVDISPLETGETLLHFRDITKEAQLDKIRADFVANASHELRTPLASLSGFIETLQTSAKMIRKRVNNFCLLCSNKRRVWRA